MLVPMEASLPLSFAKFTYAPDEDELRGKVAGTIFQPDLFAHFPGLLTAGQLVKDLSRQMHPLPLPQAALEQVEAAVSSHTLYRLQLYWVDTQLRNRPASLQWPDWARQKSRGKVAAALGIQRSPPGSW